MINPPYIAKKTLKVALTNATFGKNVVKIYKFNNDFTINRYKKVNIKGYKTQHIVFKPKVKN